MQVSSEGEAPAEVAATEQPAPSSEAPALEQTVSYIDRDGHHHDDDDDDDDDDDP
jgi:hypothetical protein